MKFVISILIIVSLIYTFDALFYSEEDTPDIIFVEEVEDPEDSKEFKRNLECLSMNIYHEARSDNKAGKLAVADVVLNRVKSKLFPNTICEVVHQAVMRKNWLGEIVPQLHRCQFSWYCDGKSDEPKNLEVYESVTELARKFLTTDKFRGITEGSTHYHARYVVPNWINDRGMQKIGAIGEHIFYRWH